jgi:hypothetical protein
MTKGEKKSKKVTSIKDEARGEEVLIVHADLNADNNPKWRTLVSGDGETMCPEGSFISSISAA